MSERLSTIRTLLRGGRIPTILAACAMLAATAVTAPPTAEAQQDVVGGPHLPAQGTTEHYLRVLQSLGAIELHPWGIRGISRPVAARMADSAAAHGHPWEARRLSAPASRLGVAIIAPRGQGVLNSAFPHSFEDGAAWAGRGLTGIAQAGASLWAGPLTVTVAPVLYYGTNAAFPLAETGVDGNGVYADPRNPRNIDYPQRFGDGPVSGIDPGESSIRLDTRWIAAGASTSRQHWGPGRTFPLILDGHAPGFLHGFVGTGEPRDIWIGRVQARGVWGVREQSEFAQVAPIDGRRFMSGIVGSFTPRGIDGLEIGGTRFFHIPWREGGPISEDFLRPFEAFLKVVRGERPGSSDGFSTPDNQLASLFARWVFPGAGFEAYGEYSRNDHSFDFRDLILQPDHDSAYLLGFQRTWQREDARIVAVRGEVMNARITHLERVRHQVPFYRHGTMRQGHTHRGQILGSPSVYGGAGATLAADLYDPRGMLSVGWERRLREDVRFREFGGLSDVLHILRADALLFRSAFDLNAGLAGVWNLNRNLEGDAFNLNARIGISAGF